MLAGIVSVVTALLALAGLAFCCVAMWGARAFAREVQREVRDEVRRARVSGENADEFAPGVSILKPLKGLDPSLHEALASHCRQEYAGAVEMLFGLADLGDPAAAVIAELQREFPMATLRVVHCPAVLGANGKVSNLVQMLPHARYEHILISDGDIRVGARYLRGVMGAFAPAAVGGGPVGLVTAPYRGRTHGRLRSSGGEASATLGSRLEALAIATDFFPGVLTARLLEGGVRFGLGSTLATTREALAAIGGLGTLVNHLADDYELGARLRGAGYRVVLSGEVVETSVVAYRLKGYWEHQLRWARSMRDSRRQGYVGLGCTYAVPWAGLHVVAAGGSPGSLALLSLVLLARVAVALSIGVGLLGDGQVLRDLWLLPLRDCLGLLLWAWSYAEDTVLWRGERMHLKRGVLTRK
ncbi:MAG TPA: bacteriohopanetetrol glucosamine biosynthesis glycosyltransferase HpnI [Acidobacteriaceae bacterium]